jgi:multiple sugar transport system permease protein
MALFPNVGSKQTGVRIGWWIMVSVLSLGMLLHLFPFYLMIVTSFKPAEEAMASIPTLLPIHPTLAAWTLVYKWAASSGDSPLLSGSSNEPFWIYFWNSLFMTFMTLLLSLPITALAAYTNSKLQRGPLARWSFLFFISTLMVPAAVTLLPTLLLTLHFPFALPGGSIPNVPGTYDPVPTISIWDTPWAIILQGVFNAYNFLIFKGFFDTIPNSVLQAARVDGGSEFNIFRRIVFPMSVPVFAVIAWIQFSAVWDNFLWPELAFQTPSKIPTSVAIYTVMNNFVEAGMTDRSQALGQSLAMKQAVSAGLSWNGLMVLALLQTIPIFIMFILCREYLLRGVRIQGLK